MAVTRHRIAYLFVCLVLLPLDQVFAAVLPEDRADLLYHRYDGDGSVFDGPSVLVRKQFKDTVSVWGNYYIDMNSAASIDVVTQGSPYEEERTESSLGFDYLHDKTILSASAKKSDENDYQAVSYSLGLSQDFFGDLSTLSMGYSNGQDEVYQNVRDGPGKDDFVGRIFCGDASHRRFNISLSQIITKNWIVAVTAEGSVDEGFLNNCYRSIRFRSANNPEESSGQKEKYPTTRNSEAYAIKSMYFLPWRGGLKLEARTFSDSWAIRASNYELRYTHPIGTDWILDVRYRYYKQTQASFYKDLFEFQTPSTFFGSDKELSNFDNTTIGFGLTYELKKEWIGWFDRATVNFYFDYVNYEYENFLDKRESQSGSVNPVNIGEESPFGFDAQISRFFISLWY